ncbi:MAG: beta-galactosidase [Lentisphaerota bacterium]
MLPEHKKNESVIKYDARSFIIRGKRELLVGGEFHYFRTPNELWEDRIVKMKRGGCNQVTTYIPWNWHEQVEGQPRWTGDQDLEKFIKLCDKHGMFLVVKPGPYICAEWDFGGHPDWLLSKKIRLRVLDEQYLSYVEKWYKKVAEVIKPYLVTRGGNIIAIQVENEYDHLVNFGTERIPLEDAIEYFRRLKDMMERNGIDIPKFANEASFLRGTDIIDTRTYYPSIPWFWRWELTNYDNNIEAARKTQPDKPTMILELQSGWFTMYGQPPFVPDGLLTEAVTNSALAAGASFFNMYMFVGGTTVPFWGCRGDIFDLYPKGTGTTTSFDFGGSPIREWGELMPERYDWLRIFNVFCQNFKDLLLESDMVEDVSILAGGENVEIIHSGSSEINKTLSSPSEKFRVISRKWGAQELVCVRNMSEDDKVIDLGWPDGREPLVKNFEIRSHESFILPFGVKIPHTDLVVERSSSSLLFSRKVDGFTVFGLFGKPGRHGETELNVPVADVHVLAGKVDVKQSAKGMAVLKYQHAGLQILKVQNHILLILDQKLASKVEELQDAILVADTYFVREIKKNGTKLELHAEMRNGSNNSFHYIGRKGPGSVVINGQAVQVVKGPAEGICSFEYKIPSEQAVRFEWQGPWKVKEDTAEKEFKYDDSAWKVLDKPISLEEAGLLKHGHIWYRMECRLPKDAKDVNISIPGNDTDRFYIYVNGKETWCGIATQASTAIQDLIKPGRNVIAVLYQNFYHNKSHPHEGDIQKYSGIMGPVVVTGTSDGKPFKRKITTFKAREELNGVMQGYAKEGFDANSWQTLLPAHKHVMSPETGTVLWMRRQFKYQCAKGWKAAVKLNIPGAKDRLLIYVNGHILGQFESIGPQFDFYIPETYLKEENVLTLILEGHKTWMDVVKGFVKEPVFGAFYETRDTDVVIES